MRIIELEAVFAPAASAEPLAWHLPYVPPALLVSFDAGGPAERAPAAAGGGTPGASLACPLQSSDRQMLRCLHAFSSHHLKAIQAADARFRPPAMFDVAEQPQPAYGAAPAAGGGAAP